MDPDLSDRCCHHILIISCSVIRELARLIEPGLLCGLDPLSLPQWAVPLSFSESGLGWSSSGLHFRFNNCNDNNLDQSVIIEYLDNKLLRNYIKWSEEGSVVSQRECLAASRSGIWFQGQTETFCVVSAQVFFWVLQFPLLLKTCTIGSLFMEWCIATWC